MPSPTASISNYLIFIAMKTAVYILAACLMAWIAMPQQADAQTLRNSSNAVLCKISSDGTVRNASNATIGTAKGVDPEWAAAYFFFKFFK